MKKLILALTAIGVFAGGAQAQSSVTVYGSVDGGIRHVTNANAAGQSRLSMGSNGTHYNNRLGFRGVEDLGGGLSARFILESGFNLGTGAQDNVSGQLFQRTASVGVAGPWGAIDFGRQYSVAFKVGAPLSPFGSNYTGITPLAGAVAGSQVLGTPTATTPAANAGAGRFNNDIQYTGTFGPWTARGEYAVGEQAGSTSNGAAQAVGLSYASGPITVGGVYTKQTSNMRTTAAPSWQDHDQWLIAGAYKVSAWRASLGYIDDTVTTDTAGDRQTKWSWGGLEYRFTPALGVTGGYYQTKVSGGGAATGKRDLYMIGATYALSKRTNYYVEIDSSKHRGILRPNGQDRTRGISLGINHLF